MISPGEPDKQMYGWFSAKSKKQGNPTAIYRHVDGREVEVNAIYDSDKFEDVRLNWDDAECLGEVAKWLRAGQDKSGYFK